MIYVLVVLLMNDTALSFGSYKAKEECEAKRAARLKGKAAYCVGASVYPDTWPKDGGW